MSGTVADKKRLLHITAGNLRQGHLYIRGHFDFFPADAVGKSRKSGRGTTVAIELDGLGKTVETDIGCDAKTGKPRAFFRDRKAIREFYRHHETQPGDVLALERLNERHYRLWGQDKAAPTEGPTVAEFFAGIGLVRLGLERAGFKVIFANDLSESKQAIYVTNFGDAHFVLQDVRRLGGDDVPTVDVATASFPCTDVSLAGNREGLKGLHSGLFWEFRRIIEEMGERKPSVVMLENVTGLVTSNEGSDLRAIVLALNDLGYGCGVLALDAKNFVPQSRPRLFIVGARGLGLGIATAISVHAQSQGIAEFIANNPDLSVVPMKLPPPPENKSTIADVVQRFPSESQHWWDCQRTEAFRKSLSSIQEKRLSQLVASPVLRWATAYRRTRAGSPVWEMRDDQISGCLRTTGGGSSKQAVVQAGIGSFRVRWMTAREYARLQGAPNLKFGGATESQVKFALGDAVCVPVIQWIGKHCLKVLLKGSLLEALHGKT